MVGLIQRRPDEVVHPGIRDHEGLAPVALDIEHFGQQSTGLSDKEAAGFEQQADFQTREGALDRGRIFSHFGDRVEVGTSGFTLPGDRAGRPW